MMPLRWAVPLGAAILLPWLALVVLGLLWLWEHEGVLWWLGGAFLITSVSVGIGHWLRRRPLPTTVAAADHWSNDEHAAWHVVEAHAEAVDPADFPIDERLHHRLLELGLDVTRAVGRAQHPESDEPLMEATIPQLLAMGERVARDLRTLCAQVPMSERLTLRQWYRLRHLRHLSSAHDLYRIGRMVFNPVGALAAELRDQVQGQLYTATRGEVLRWLLQSYVRATGRYAIDLFAGFAMDAHGAPARVCITGTGGSGRHALLEALGGTGSGDSRARQGDALLPDAVFTLAPPESVLVDDADLVLVVTPAVRAARTAEHELVTRCVAGGRPCLVVMTQVDLLPPARQWSPPYDLEAPGDAKGRAIAEARAHVAGELGLALERVIPVAVNAEPAFNVDTGLLEALEELLRTEAAAHRMRDAAKERRSWRRVGRQAGELVKQRLR